MNLGEACSICGHTNIVYSGKTRHYRRHVAMGEAVELVRNWDMTVSQVFLPVSATGAIETLLSQGYMRAAS